MAGKSAKPVLSPGSSQGRSHPPTHFNSFPSCSVFQLETLKHPRIGQETYIFGSKNPGCPVDFVLFKANHWKHGNWTGRNMGAAMVLDQNSVPKRWGASCWTSSRLGLTKTFASTYDLKTSDFGDVAIFSLVKLVKSSFCHLCPHISWIAYCKVCFVSNCLIKAWNPRMPHSVFWSCWAGQCLAG